jgi:hypothetical protein
MCATKDEEWRGGGGLSWVGILRSATLMQISAEINSCRLVVAHKRTLYISFGSWVKLPEVKLTHHEHACRICR